jgi:hypothetical protein
MLATEKLTGVGDLDIICFCASVGASLKKEMVLTLLYGIAQPR